MSTNNKISELKDKEVLVTGGCGFIGSEITKQLSSYGAFVTIIDNLSSGKEENIKGIKNVELIKSDLSDQQVVQKIVKDKEYIINLAALPFIPDSYYFPRKFFDVNVNLTIDLAIAAIKEKKIKRFIHISSSEIYGTARYIPMDENHPTTPQSTYAVSKLAGERVIFTLHKEHNLPAVIIRPFNSFGPNITQPYIIPEIINQMLKSDIIELGNLNSKRDLTFVSDTAHGIISSLVMEGAVGEVINIGSGRAFSIRDLVAMIAEILEKDVEIKVDPTRFRPFDVDTLICNYDRASRVLDWTPKISVKEGLEITIKWIKENGVNINTPFSEQHELM
jgi:nucleoside-diphosphate-sugar epimerase